MPTSCFRPSSRSFPLLIEVGSNRATDRSSVLCLEIDLPSIVPSNARRPMSRASSTFRRQRWLPPGAHQGLSGGEHCVFDRRELYLPKSTWFPRTQSCTILVYSAAWRCQSSPPKNMRFRHTVRRPGPRCGIGSHPELSIAFVVRRSPPRIPGQHTELSFRSHFRARLLPTQDAAGGMPSGGTPRSAWDAPTTRNHADPRP